MLRNDVSVDPGAISRFGIPSTTGSIFSPRDRDYCDVQVDYSRNPLIFTISDGERAYVCVRERERERVRELVSQVVVI